MLNNSTTIIPYKDIDFEIRDLIRYINEVEGIETTESCCGHGESPCCIWFKADNIECLTKFWYKYLYGNPNWRIVLKMTDIDIDNEEWDKPTYLLYTTFSDYYYTGLAIDNLKMKFSIQSVTPKQKTGHWIYIGNGNNGLHQCSQCGAERKMFDGLEIYCSSCGAKMIEPHTESEDVNE